jgi:branched-chain amino acid transport system ATP-binding protein
MNAEAPALEFRDVTAGYGETRVLEGVSLSLGAGESLSLIGRNGVGKTTLLATAMGHTDMHSGSVYLHGEDITTMPIHRRARAGLGFVPQEREIFPSLTVRENLMIGAREGGWTQERVFDLFPNIAERQGNAGNQLSGGEQQMLAIARALMSNPDVLLMDEPSEGLAPILVEQLMNVMETLRADGGLSLILVEQNTRVALAFSERTVVLDRGKIVYDADSATLRKDEKRLDELIGVSG